MAFYVNEETGNIELIQGDSGYIIVNGLPTNKNYTLYFCIKNKKRETVGNELSLSTNQAESIELQIGADLTDLLTVPLSEEYETYYFGIKLCYTDPETLIETEETLFLGNSTISDMNTITVYPKRVEGYTND